MCYAALRDACQRNPNNEPLRAAEVDAPVQSLDEASSIKELAASLIQEGGLVQKIFTEAKKLAEFLFALSLSAGCTRI